MKIGDKIRFLSETGGGKIAGFQGKDIVLVEDEDGFQIPTAITDVVVVEDEDYSTRHVVETKMKPKVTIPDDDEDYDPADRPIAFKAPVEERKGGEQLCAYLAFVPMDIKAITSSRFEAYFINDSNYYMHYAYFTAEGNSWQLHSTAEVEPNTKLFIEEFGREELGELDRVCLQVMAYKRDKAFLLKPAIDVQLRIDPVKFYKLHTFQPSDFFREPALVYEIVKDDELAQPMVVSPDDIKEALLQKKETDIPAKVQRKQHQVKNEIVEVDLHIHELLDDTTGMGNAEMLNYQLDVFRQTLEEYKHKKGQKIVFIHGKGDGVLRRAILDELKRKYKTYQSQDASFREYGFGATMVTIH